MSHPTTSAPYAMAEYAQSRRAELDALLCLVDWPARGAVLDIQAAGGFVADAVHARSAGALRCICLEPSATLAARISSQHEVVREEVDDFPSIPDRSIDVAIGLAGLHHSRSAPATLREAYRVLRAGGQLALCDVEPESSVARWLNEFVNAHNPAGHAGAFIDQTSLSTTLHDAGFSDVETRIAAVPWRFKSKTDLVRFFRGLFGLECDDPVIAQGIGDYFSLTSIDGEVAVDWKLIYARARKPR